MFLMTQINSWQKKIPKELMINLLLWVLYFIGVAYQNGSKNTEASDVPYLQLADIIISCNYFMVVMVINYLLLPHFFYKKRYLSFAGICALLLFLAIVVEEFWLEPLVYPDSPKGTAFLGYFATLLQISPTILLFVGFKFAWDNLQKQSALEQMEKEKVESQLQFLKSQLNPHFLFNNLNNLYSYAQEQSPKTPEIIMQLSAIMRYILYESQGQLVALEKELTYLGHFIELQELQMEERGKVEFYVEGEVQAKRIAPLILITFVENSFKHSLSSLADNILIVIRIGVVGDRLSFHCSNRYRKGQDPSRKLLSNGVGLQNIRKRLELQYFERYQLDITAEDDIYQVDLQLDLSEA